MALGTVMFIPLRHVIYLTRERRQRYQIALNLLNWPFFLQKHVIIEFMLIKANTKHLFSAFFLDKV